MNAKRKPSILFVYFTYTKQTLKLVEAMSEVFQRRGCDVHRAAIESDDPRYATRFEIFPMAPGRYRGVEPAWNGTNVLLKLHTDNPRLQRLSDADHAIVSEPLGDLPGAWLEVPESTAVMVAAGSHEQRPFRSPPPGTTANRKRPVGREVYAYGEGRGQVT